MKILYLTPRHTWSELPPNVEPVTVEQPDRIPLRVLIQAGAWILEVTEPSWAQAMIKFLRTFDDPQIYLKPVFGFPRETELPAFWDSLLDGKTDLGHLQPILSFTEPITEKSKKLEPLQTEHFEVRLTLRLLRFLYTRDTRLLPIRDATSRTGYTYPFLALHLRPDDQARMFDVLDLAEREGLLSGRFVDRFHLCPECLSAFLNFRETCPACGSPNLKREDLIHHFVCAYIAPESDFLHGEDLICPKCHRQLRHIGVDYDRPSVLYTCRTCGHEFQTPVVRVLCFQCGSDHLVENLLEKVVKEYELTSKGQNAALSGFTLTLRTLIQIDGVVDYETFKAFLRHEIERVRRTERPSSLAYFEFSNSEDLYLKIGERRTRVFEEIARVIRENIRGSDILSYLNERTLLFLYPETPVEGTQIALNRITAFIHQLVQDNFQDFQAKLKVHAIPIDPNGNIQDHLERLFST